MTGRMLLLVVWISPLLFLAPLPATSADSVMTAEQYIETYKYYAVREMLLYKIPASITLAQGLLESGNGNSRLAREANNHFGIKCHTDWEGPRIYEDDDEKGECFRVYTDPEASFRDHSIFLATRSRYGELFKLDQADYRGWAKGLKAAGYATNPKYPDLLITRIEKYSLQDLDTVTSLTGIAPWEPPLAENLDRLPPEDPDNDSGEDIIIPGSGYEVYVFNNSNCISARTGDTPGSLAASLDMMKWQILKYNDVDETYVFRDGERVFIQPKRSKGSKATHTVVKGETLRDISQAYGVKQQKITRYNSLTPGEDLIPGTVLQLRHKSR